MSSPAAVVSRRPAELVWAALLFSVFGLCTELVFTGFAASWEGSFRGQVSLLMVPVYALAYGVVGLALRVISRFDLRLGLWRVALGVLLVYAIEWSAGAAYGSLGLRPWHYEHGWASNWSNGLVTLYYAPVWAIFVVIAERVWHVATAAAPHADRVARRELRCGIGFLELRRRDRRNVITDSPPSDHSHRRTSRV